MALPSSRAAAKLESRTTVAGVDFRNGRIEDDIELNFGTETIEADVVLTLY
jgi:hypothetical protein